MSGGSRPATPAIQPDGFLLLLGAEWQLLGVSENIGDYLGSPAEVLIGQPVSALFAERAVHLLRNRLALRRAPDAVARSFGCRLLGEDRPRFDVAMHGSEDWVIIEAQPSPSDDPGDCAETVRGMIAALGRHHDLGELLADAARQLRALTGYDQVLICRWAEDCSHELVAESARASAECVPPSELIAEPPGSERVIRDSEATPIPVISGGEADLARASLRAATSSERRRLGAAGCRALLSRPLLCAGRPWGMITCHHPQPRRLGFERLAAVELFAQMLGLLIEIAELRAP